MADLPLSCPICDQRSSRQSEIGGFEYFRCSSCDHVFLERRHEPAFGRDFYVSHVYKDREAKWPKADRLQLFDRMVAHADIALGRQARLVLGFGAGSQDIDERRLRAPTSPSTTPTTTTAMASRSSSRSKIRCRHLHPDTVGLRLSSCGYRRGRDGMYLRAAFLLRWEPHSVFRHSKERYLAMAGRRSSTPARASPFTSHEVTNVLQTASISISMDGPGASRDNVFVKQFSDRSSTGKPT